MSDHKMDQFFNEIGTILTERREDDTKAIILYTYLANNVVGASIFIEESDYIEYSFPSEDLGDALLEFWEEQPKKDRWVEMEYVLRGDKVDVTFIYADQIDPDDDFLDRRTRAVVRHFGDKPIIYPSLEDDDTQRFEL